MYKEALHDVEQCLFIKPDFAKAHVRAFTCYLQTGQFDKAEASLLEAKRLGEKVGITEKEVQIAQLLKNDFVVDSAFMKANFREAKSYLNQMLKQVPTSLKHTCRMIECLICDTPTDMSEAIRFCTSV